jgi:PleD family two-component response regulator
MTNEYGHILVVDDNRMNRLKLSRSLEQQGHANRRWR